MSGSLSQLAADARRAMHAVVQIHAYGFNQSSIPSILDPRFPEPAHWRGSGFLIDIDGHPGHILTNAHVVRNATRLQMMSLSTSEEMFALELVGLVSSQEPDVALVRLTDEALKTFRQRCGGEIPTLPLGDSDKVERGNNIKAIGYPFGMAEPNISGGEISNFIAGDPENSERLVTDAAINPGNSGGPAVGDGGVAFGINTSVVADADNIGFVTPIDWARILIPQMLEHGEAQLADPGACFQPNSPPNATYLGQDIVDGVIVMRVFAGGMLASGGLQRLDVITSINSVGIDEYGNLRLPEGQRRRTLYDAIRRIPVGESVDIDYTRAGKPTSVRIDATVRPRIDIVSQPLIEKRRYVEFRGLIIQELTLEIAGAISTQIGTDFLANVEGRPSPKPRLVISFVMPGSEADNLFFVPGSIVVRAGAQDMGTLEEFVAAVNATRGQCILETQLGGLGAFAAWSDGEDRATIASPPVAPH